MAGTEVYGGICPSCLKGMFQKHETSWSGLMYDACPWCSFIGGTLQTVPLTDEQKANVWKDILEHYGVGSLAGLQEAIDREEYPDADNGAFFPSIFDHRGEADTLLAYTFVWNKLGLENGVVASADNPLPATLDDLVGERVYWHTTPQEVGTIMEVRNGDVFILWDEFKGAKFDYHRYPLADLGTFFLFLPELTIDEEWDVTEVLHVLDTLAYHGIPTSELREKFMAADVNMYETLEANDTQANADALEAMAIILDAIRQLAATFARP